MTGWTVVVPVKRWAFGKSRLTVDPATRQDLARGLALDVIEAVTQCSVVERLVLVTAEQELRLPRLGGDAVVLADRPLLRGDGLNDAVGSGLAWARTRRPEAPVAIVPADLAALTTYALGAGLSRLAEHDRAFVADAAGDGTTIVTSRRPGLLTRTAYGPASAAAHAAMGLSAEPDVDKRLRLDVDTVQDLFMARVIGIGPQLRAALERANVRQIAGGHAAVG